jgi:hypothetical protein
MATTWFDLDKTGLGKQAEEQGKGRLVGELVQNALDEAGVTRVEITLSPVPGRPLADLSVEDDSPEGFRNLADAYTLFAESYKRSNPEQRGQFNLGEKLVIACCETATISTTKGTVVFDAEAGRIEKPHQKRERGSIFRGRMRMNREEMEEVGNYLRCLLLPETIAVTFNGDPLKARKPLHVFQATLPAVVADTNGIMRTRDRKTQVSILEVQAGETATLYEMGLPIVETGDKWHLNVGQKVPLNKDRNNVTPAYLRAIRTLVLNEMYGKLGQADANETWVRQASSDPDCSHEAIKKVLDLRFGERRAAYDPSDPESNKTWVSKGGTVVYGSMMNAQEWQKAKEAGAIDPAGKLCPSPKAYSDDPNANAAEIVPEAEWTEGMRNIASYSVFLGKELLGATVSTIFVNTMNSFDAAFGKCELHFNVFHLGRTWFDQGATEVVDKLVIHEFGHHFSGDHLSEAYHEALCLLGARLKRLALEKPEEVRRFVRFGNG